MAKEQKEPDAKERILEAAIRLFARKGYAGTGLRELAKTAGVNLAMINYYFGSKQGLLEAVFDKYFEQHARVVSQITELEAPLDQRIRYGLRCLVDMFRQDPDLVRVAFTELPYDLPEFAEYKANKIRTILQPLFGEIVPKVQEASPRRLAPVMVAPSLLGAPVFHFLMRPVLSRLFASEFDDAFYEEYADQIADIFLYGVFGRAPDSSR